MSDAQATNLAGREEIIGRKYPVYLERILLLIVVVVFVLGYENVSTAFSSGLVSLIVTWCMFPFVLLFTAEMIGRLIQAVNRT